MTVFKHYLQIVKKNIGLVLIYFAIFSLIAIVAGRSTTNTTFKPEEPKITIFDNDLSDLSKNFTKYIKSKSIIVEVDEEKVMDALVNFAIDYAIIIPENFEKKFIDHDEILIESKYLPNSFAAKYVENTFNQYLKYYKTYLLSGVDQIKIDDLVIKDLEINSSVTLLSKTKEKSESILIFFNMMNYTILGTCLYIIGLITSKFMEIKVKRRNLISSMPISKINRQLFLGHITVTIVVWLYYIILSIVLYKESMLSTTGLLLMLNSLLFCIMTLSLAFMLGTIIKKNETRGGVINVIALGSSFLCGAFVPRELLPNQLQTYTQILPSHWYILNNENIMNFNNINISKIIYPMVIIIIFTIFFFLLTNIITKVKSKEEQ